MKQQIINKRNEIYRLFGVPGEELKKLIGNEESEDKGAFSYHIKKLQNDNNLKREVKGNEKRYWEYYFTEIFPISLRIFQAMARYQLSDGALNAIFNNKEWYLPRIIPDFVTKRYDVLISLVGFSPEPIMHTICTLQPVEKIYLICTSDSINFYGANYEKFISSFVNQKSLKLDVSDDPVELSGIDMDKMRVNVETKEIDSVFSDRIIEEIGEIIENEKGKRIAIDITGGKKIMLAGAFTIASIQSIGAFYVDFQEYDTKTGKPVYGTEFLNKVKNPLAGYILKKNGLFEYFKRGIIVQDDEDYDKFLKVRSELNDVEQQAIDDLVYGQPNPDIEPRKDARSK